MSRAIFNRMLLAIHGQGDELATRYPRAHCSGCTQGCDLCDVELACEIHPDADRVIRAPIRTRSEQEQYLFWRRWSKLVAMAAIAALVALLKLAGARSMR